MHGVVSADLRTALYSVTALRRSLTWPPRRLRLPGLDPPRSYRVSVPDPGGRGTGGPARPPWVHEGVTLSGRALGAAGIQLLPLAPEHSHLILAEEVA